MKTPYWEERTLRPERNGKQAILSYEIYSMKTYPDEHTTIRTLNELVERGEAELFYHKKFLWYVGVGSNEEIK